MYIWNFKLYINITNHGFKNRHCNTLILSLWLSPYIVIIIIELGYNMRVHSKMEVDNFVVLQNRWEN